MAIKPKKFVMSEPIEDGKYGWWRMGLLRTEKQIRISAFPQIPGLNMRQLREPRSDFPLLMKQIQDQKVFYASETDRPSTGGKRLPQNVAECLEEAKKTKTDFDQECECVLLQNVLSNQQKILDQLDKMYQKIVDVETEVWCIRQEEEEYMEDQSLQGMPEQPSCSDAVVSLF